VGPLGQRERRGRARACGKRGNWAGLLRAEEKGGGVLGLDGPCGERREGREKCWAGPRGFGLPSPLSSSFLFLLLNYSNNLFGFK
jgi:hypothetical protein